MKSMIGIVLFAVAAFPVPGQSSAGYTVESGTFNAAGRPGEQTAPASASYRITMDSLGEGVIRTGLESASYRQSAGVTASCRPPGEIRRLNFQDKVTLDWDGEKSAGTYQLYRDDLTTLSSGGTGSCYRDGLVESRWTEGVDPDPSAGWFYLVTVSNRLGEEGPRGLASDGEERVGSTCP